jgi:hypothetical protein
VPLAASAGVKTGTARNAVAQIASAANLKFLRRKRRIPAGNFKWKSGTGAESRIADWLMGFS